MFRAGISILECDNKSLRVFLQILQFLQVRWSTQQLLPATLKETKTPLSSLAIRPTKQRATMHCLSAVTVAIRDSILILFCFNARSKADLCLLHRQPFIRRSLFKQV